MPALRSLSWKPRVGSLVLVGALVGLVLLLSTPAITRPAGRVLAALGSAFVAERSDDLVVTLSDLTGISVGLPAYLVDISGNSRPLAHVASFGTGKNGAWARLRFEPGEDTRGPWRLIVHPPGRSLGAALDVAVTDEAARRFGAEIAQRLERLWQEALLPEAEARLPSFLARIDPAADTQARVLMQDLSAAALEKLNPLLDQLASHVSAAIKGKFDMLARLGLLWKVVKGDAAGLQREVLPVAREAAQAWWAEHERDVLAALGAAVREQLGSLKAWAGGELFRAARTELVDPILAAQRERLEHEGEAILRSAADTFVRAPRGGFRVRFASVLRTHLLRKDTALLLLEPAGEPR